MVLRSVVEHEDTRIGVGAMAQILNPLPLKVPRLGRVKENEETAVDRHGLF